MNAPADLISLIQDLAYVLDEMPEELVLNYAGETSPLDIDFIYEPVLNEVNINISARQTEKKADEVSRKILTRDINYLCVDCPEKMYPVKKYLRPGKKPILVLHYNGASAGRAKPDRSDRFVFGSEEEDELFGRMCTAAGFSMSDFNFQEFPACHFAAASDSEADWRKRAENCMRHVIHTIRERKIKFLIYMGSSALILWGKNRAQEKFESMNIFDPEINNESLNAMVLRSPGALLALENKRKRAKEENRSEILAEEKKVKTLILNALKKISEAVG